MVAWVVVWAWGTGIRMFSYEVLVNIAFSPIGENNERR
jgi:hypothetical protein